ncbi:MAG: hypothetical protein J7507_11070 [Pseudoxanthomonas sp.]|nr:hypothetical protein [Pseudoxanthomonas sp.]
MQDSTTSPTAPDDVPAAGPDMTGGPPVAAAPAPITDPWLVRTWRLLLREPSLLVATSYLFVSFIGLWASFWFYRMFGLPILEYMQASDYLVAGLRDPAYAALLVFSALLAALISWPEFYRVREPERVATLRRRWWGRLLFPEHRWLRWQGLGMAPVTGVVFAVFLGMVCACTAYVATRAVDIRDDGAGNRVEVTLAGDSAPLPGQAQLLGTTSAFVLLWWPQQQRAEAVPVGSIKRLGSLRPPAPPSRMVAPARARANAEAAPAAAATGAAP